MESTSRWLADQIDDFDKNFTAQELATAAVERDKLMESVEGLFCLFNASVALSRSALEQALSSKIPTLLQGAAGGDTLRTLINTARSSILKQAPEICNAADQVRKVANRIVHGETCKERGAFRVLKDTRDIIVYLYRKNA